VRPDRTPTARQIEVLGAMERLTRRQGPTYRALSEAIGVSSSHAAVDHIRLLEKKGLVERSDDRRSWVVSAAGLRALKWKRRPAA
jgi:DNA-binding MarR family transcriptional regulator